MKISKTTINFASARGVDLCVDVESGDLLFYSLDDDCGEYAFSYTIQESINGDVGLFFKGNIWLPQEVKEELPHWVRDEKHLRELIAYVAPFMLEDG